MPGEDVSGIGATAALWCSNNGQVFVELRLTHFPELGSTPIAPRYYVAEPAQPGQRLPIEVSPADLALLEDDADDRLDFLPHDFTIEQAAQLYDVLGQLLAYAQHTPIAVPQPV